VPYCGAAPPLFSQLLDLFTVSTNILVYGKIHRKGGSKETLKKTLALAAILGAFAASAYT